MENYFSFYSRLVSSVASQWDSIAGGARLVNTNNNLEMWERGGGHLYSLIDISNTYYVLAA